MQYFCFIKSRNEIQKVQMSDRKTPAKSQLRPNQGYVAGYKIYIPVFFTAPLNWRTFAAR